MIIYRGHELTKDHKGWWVWLKDTRVNDRPISSEQQAKVWLDMRKTEEVQRKAAIDPR